MEKITKSSLFQFEQKDSGLVNDLAIYLDENFQTIYHFFGMDNDYQKPIIHIVATKKELDDIYRRFNDLDSNDDVPKWLVGLCASDMQIYYLSLNDYKNTSHAFDDSEYDSQLDMYKKTILHEFIHYVHRSFCKKIIVK